MTENNYNLLYSKFGWYNNYYILPHERLMNVYALPTGHGLKECDEMELSHLYKVTKYSRCMYGRALLCSTGHNYYIEFVKNGISSRSIHRSDIPSNDLKSSFVANNLLSCYPLETVSTDHLCYLDFYLRVMEMPLL
jgi:hypothetical protein